MRNQRLFALLIGCWLTAVPATLTAQTDDESDDSQGLEAGQAPEVQETIVVTASRTEQQLHDVPASISVLSSEDIEQIPADDYGDLLRNIPGVNVSQLSARDVQVTTRSSTNSLAASQLVLVDGRTLYLDFFGFVMWDFLPSNPREIKQIEVVRGPGSAVWGANAMSGVINVITKSPKEMVGTDLALGAGELGTLFGSINHAGVNDKWSYKIGGGYYEQDPYDRPAGAVPGSEGPFNPGGTPYPQFENEGTEQPKVDVRFDYDPDLDSTWSFSAGWADTDGIVHSGIGPFDITEASMSYGKVNWTKLAANVNAFVNVLDGDADNQLTVGLDGRPLEFLFDTTSTNIDASNTSVVGGNNILTYGGNARFTDFELSIAPGEDSREEYGAFLQDEILLGDKWRWLIGARIDSIDPIDTVFSPRTSLMYSPNPNHTLRASFNRAFKSPSLVNNYLDIVIVNVAPLPTGPFIFPSLAGGNVELEEEKLDAIELGYLGTFGDKTVSLAVYENDTEDSHDFFTAGFYSAANPPPGFPLPPIVLDIPPPAGLAGLLPCCFSYRNIGNVTDRGLEFSYDETLGNGWAWGFNYSYQDDPEVEGIGTEVRPNGDVVEAVNLPPQSRANLRLGYDDGGWFFNANANYQDDAFWTDILDPRFWGPTDSFTMLNAGIGVRLNEGRVSLSVDAQNLTDEDVQQHVFGDIISRKVVGKVAFTF